jgi:radical S-adenosyl methionine domain-containing protein 2
MRCKFCYATFNDIGVVKHDFQKSSEIIKQLSKAGFRKMNFAGGEPTLIRELPALAKLSKELGMTTTIVTNGAKLSQKEVYDNLIPYLDWVAISIDSLSDEGNLQSGRALNGKTVLTRSYYADLILKLKADGIKIKINTVVSRYNYLEDISDFINKVKPDRWKILQAMPVDDQNSIQRGNFEITNAQFSSYLERNKRISSEIDIIPELIEFIKGSYVMVSPEGSFFDSTKGKHTYSAPILEVGVDEALKQVNFDHDLFIKRGGLYNWGTRLK